MKIKNILTAVLITTLFISCDPDYPDTLFDPDYRGNPAPVISSVDPAESSLAGVGIITITGNNFSPVNHENMVYIGTKSSKVLESSETRLLVQAPNEIGDSLLLRVAVTDAISFSNSLYYSLLPAIETYGDITESQMPWGIAIDADGSVYVSVSRGGSSDGVQKILPDGTLEEYVPARIPRYDAMKFGPDGHLYLVRNIRLIARVPPGGGAEENWLPFPVGTRLIDLDFDEHGYLWAVGNNENIFRVQMNEKSIEEFLFDADVKSVRYFDGSLYVSAITQTNDNEQSNIWRFPVDNTGNPGDPEIYFAFSEKYGENKAIALAITFSKDGHLYIGTDGPDGIIVVHPGGNEWEPLYPGLVLPKGLVFAWGDGPNLYYTRGETGNIKQALIRVNMQREGAPYFGIE